MDFLFSLAGLGLVIGLSIWYANVNTDRSSFKELIGKMEQHIQRVEEWFQQVDQWIRRFQQVDKGFQQVEQRTQRVEERLQQVEQRTQRVEERLQRVEQGFQRMEQGLQRAEENFHRLSNISHGAPPVTMSDNPRRLSEYGVRLSQFLAAVEWAESEAETLLRDVQDKDPYGVQEYCNTYVDGYQPTALEYQKFRDCMFEHGATRTHVNDVLALVLCNKLLARLGIVPAES